MSSQAIHRTITRPARIAVAAVGFGVLAPLVAGQCYYDVTVLDTIDCGIFGEGWITPRSIADNGWITGAYPQCDFDAGSWVALRQRGTSVQALIPPFAGVTNAEGRGISSTGLIVGTMDVSGVGQRGFIYDHGTGQWEDLPWLPGGTFAEAQAVNGSGIAVGRTGNQVTGPSPLAVMWVDGQPVDLGALLGSPKSEARDINEAGTIVGWHGSSSSTDAHAFIYDGMVTTLDAVPGGATSEGIATNENEDVLVFGFVADPSYGSVRRGFVYRDGRFVPLGILPGFIHMIPQDIAGDGTVVGWCQGTEFSINDREAFIWRDGALSNIDLLIDPVLELDTRFALSINDFGQITALATGAELQATSAVVLTPPNPADLDGNCVVDVSDLLILLADWGNADSPADFDGSGAVDIVDLLFLFGHWS